VHIPVSVCATPECHSVLCGVLSCRLSELSKRMFSELGSAVVQNVKFRDAWAMVSQKGVEGFTSIEQVGVVECCVGL